jgi:hypothetical protein
VLTLCQRPARDFIFAGEPDIFFPPHVIEDSIEHADGRRTRAYPVVQTDDHHPSPLRTLFIKLVELFFKQQLELREIVDMEKVVQIVEMGRIGDGANLALWEGESTLSLALADRACFQAAQERTGDRCFAGT